MFLHNSRIPFFVDFGFSTFSEWPHMAAIRAGSLFDAVRFSGPVWFAGPVRFAQFAGSRGSPDHAVRLKIVPKHEHGNGNENGTHESGGPLDRTILHRILVRTFLWQRRFSDWVRRRFNSFT